jgi:hypothetical protein
MAAPTIKAIETEYAGCRFRSRLEARWAVFFDHLDFPWQYEPQGYVVGPDDDQHTYLPDFYLPNAVGGKGLWVEVKGQLTKTDQRTLLRAADPRHGLPPIAADEAADPYFDQWRILLLGDVPRVQPGWMCWHHVIGWTDGWKGPGLYTSAVLFTAHGLLHTGDPGVVIDALQPETHNPSAWNFGAFVVDDSLVEPGLPEWAASRKVANAYKAARSARFEHGEHGPRRSRRVATGRRT